MPCTSGTLVGTELAVMMAGRVHNRVTFAALMVCDAVADGHFRPGMDMPTDTVMVRCPVGDAAVRVMMQAAAVVAGDAVVRHVFDGTAAG
jgi:hypothetical protein